MKLEKLLPGMTVYDVGRSKMGNTTLTTVSVWHVRIVSVDSDRRSVTASWNSNPEKVFYEKTWSKWRAKRPVLIGTLMGGYRLARRGEVVKAP